MDVGGAVIMRMVFCGLLLVSLVCGAQAQPGKLEPKHVVVIANQAVADSVEVAQHYLAKRKVPKENLILLDLPTGEDMSRKDYNEKMVKPLRQALKDRKDQIRVLLTVYGVPLRVGGQEPSAEEKAQLDKLRPQMETLRKEMAELEKKKAESGVAGQIKVLIRN